MNTKTKNKEYAANQCKSNDAIADKERWQQMRRLERQKQRSSIMRRGPNKTVRPGARQRCRWRLPTRGARQCSRAAQRRVSRDRNAKSVANDLHRALHLRQQRAAPIACAVDLSRTKIVTWQTTERRCTDADLEQRNATLQRTSPTMSKKVKRISKQTWPTRASDESMCRSMRSVTVALAAICHATTHKNKAKNADR